MQGLEQCGSQIGSQQESKLNQNHQNSQIQGNTPVEDDDIDDEIGSSEQDWDEWVEGDGLQCDDLAQSLFDTTKLPLSEILEYDQKVHQFDLVGLFDQVCKDHYDCVRIINYIRHSIQIKSLQPSEVKQQLQQLQRSYQQNQSGQSGDQQDGIVQSILSNDQWLVPVQENDSLLWTEWMEIKEMKSLAQDVTSHEDQIAKAGSRSEQARLTQLMEQLNINTNTVDSVEQQRSRTDGAVGGSSAIDIGGGVGGGENQQAQQQSKKQIDDAAYFDSYGRLSIHYDMLSDKVRMSAYSAMLCPNTSALNNKQVIDIGCGSGVLCMMAVKGGAARVIGIEANEHMSKYATQVIQRNNMAEKVSIKCINAELLSHINDSRDGKVDVIVSEWMGYGLLFEDMLPTVLRARDRLLRPGGYIIPDKAKLYAAGVTGQAIGTEFWDDVYGFNMDVFKDIWRQKALDQPLVQTIDIQHINTSTATVVDWDLMTLTPQQCNFTHTFTLSHNCKSCQEGSQLSAGVDNQHTCSAVEGVGIWFDVIASDRYQPVPVVLSTSPGQPVTHWRQCVLAFQQGITLACKACQQTNQSGSNTQMLCKTYSGVQCTLSIATGQGRDCDLSLQVCPFVTSIGQTNTDTNIQQGGVELVRDQEQIMHYKFGVNV